jgi:hypothetical protein
MPLASKMLLQLAAQYIGQLTDIERELSGSLFGGQGLPGERAPGVPRLAE